MAEIADAIIDGEFDCMTGEYLGEPCDYPRTMERNHPDSFVKKRTVKNSYKGVVNFLVKKGIEEKKERNKIMITYFKERHPKHTGFITPKEASPFIQTEFGKFARWFGKNYLVLK